MQPDSDEFEQFRALALGMLDFPTADEPDGHRLIEDCFFAVRIATRHCGRPVRVGVRGVDGVGDGHPRSGPSIRCSG